MDNKLAGTLIVYNAISQDYCVIEAIESLRAVCDKVIVVDCGSTDGTKHMLHEIEQPICLMFRSTSEWNAIKGREKLSYFTNIAIDAAKTMGYEWQLNLQADEILHESSFPFIHEAINKNNEGFYLNRINLWGNSQHQLNVPQERKPVSTEVIRLCKTNYQSVDDAESILCPASTEYIDKIRIYHMGFVRDKHKHIEKIKHIQDEIFLMEHDKRVDDMPNGFEPFSMGFTKEDLIPIKEPLPIFIREWAKERDRINGIVI